MIYILLFKQLLVCEISIIYSAFDLIVPVSVRYHVQLCVQISAIHNLPSIYELCISYASV
jgi:hypothetical protein